MPRKHLLVIEDDEDILELITHNLTREGYTVTGAASGEAGLKKAKDAQVDCLLLDLMLPGIDGLEVCRRFKADARLAEIPIVMVTAKGEESDVVTGLEIGADDYIVKPFSPRILLARLKSLLRRETRKFIDDGAVLAVHDLTIHPGRFEVKVGNDPVELTSMEFRALHFLASQPGWVFTRYQIINGIRTDNYPVTDRAIDVLIVGLRKKLGTAADYIETVRGVGYRFKDSV